MAIAVKFYVLETRIKKWQLVSLWLSDGAFESAWCCHRSCECMDAAHCLRAQSGSLLTTQEVQLLG